MTDTTITQAKAEEVLTDPMVCGYGVSTVRNGDTLSAVRSAYNAACARVPDRQAVMVEVHVRVAPKA